MVITKLQLLLLGAALAAASSLLTHLYDETAMRQAIQRNAFAHAHWTADQRLF
jgi:hypothetical protein